MDAPTPPEVKRFLRAVQQRIPIDRAILFGSRARQDALEDSDFDLILVSPAFHGTPFFTRPAALLLLWDSPREVDLLCYTPEEFETKSQGINIVSAAVSEGVDVAA